MLEEKSSELSEYEYYVLLNNIKKAIFSAITEI